MDLVPLRELKIQVIYKIFLVLFRWKDKDKGGTSEYLLFLRGQEMKLRNTEGVQIYCKDNINNRNSTASLFFPMKCSCFYFWATFLLLWQQHITHNKLFIQVEIEGLGKCSCLNPRTLSSWKGCVIPKLEVGKALEEWGH